MGLYRQLKFLQCNEHTGMSDSEPCCQYFSLQCMLVNFDHVGPLCDFILEVGVTVLKPILHVEYQLVC